MESAFGDENFSKNIFFEKFIALEIQILKFFYRKKPMTTDNIVILMENNFLRKR